MKQARHGGGILYKEFLFHRSEVDIKDTEVNFYTAGVSGIPLLIKW